MDHLRKRSRVTGDIVRLVQGDIFQSCAQTLVNPVNCRGASGKGLALEFSRRWPEMAEAYQQACGRGEVRIGHPFLFRKEDRQVLCLPTKDDWRKPSKYEFIEAGLGAIRDRFKEWEIKSLAVPALGCGLGGLEWDKIKSVIVRYLSDLPIDIEVYEPEARSSGLGR